MTEHLTDNLLTRYRQRALDAAELWQLDAHLQNCAACQTRLTESTETAASLAALQTALADVEAQHLAYEELAAYVDRQLAAPARELAEMHLRECRNCTAELNDLRAFRRELDDAEVVHVAPAQPVRRKQERAWWQPSGWRWPLQLAATAAACLLVAWLATRNLRQEVTDLRAQLATAQRDKARLQTELLAAQTRNAPLPNPFAAPPTAPTPEPANLIAALTDGATQITLDRQGQLNGLTEINPPQRQLVLLALQAGKVTLPAAPAPLGNRPDVLLGAPAGGETFALRAPVGKVVLADRPQLRWQPLKNATSYRVTIFTANYESVAQSQDLSTTTWTPPQPLPRERVYLWQVTASKDGQEIKAPVAPAPEARFKILDQAKADEIAAARRRTPVSNLLLGLLYAQAGLFDEAERELQKLAQANPQAPLAKQLLNDLRTQRRSLNQ
ncbi:MAG: zf-HC2 domain-containing protein [Acidobacteria bacterium]|nr:zf-HC2 domain-containing protein [Acidobacteriota bacterium]MBI3422026.1 zf-HC2 domain-containing protein [Acidobacteriota bacterium]